jgi:hypothetical protein
MICHWETELWCTVSRAPTIDRLSVDFSGEISGETTPHVAHIRTTFDFYLYSRRAPRNAIGPT